MVTKQDVGQGVTDKAQAVQPATAVPDNAITSDKNVFKCKTLDELLAKAALLQRVIAVLGATETYDLEATYDIVADEWTGRLCKR
jgi:hypothetical protein